MSRPGRYTPLYLKFVLPLLLLLVVSSSIVTWVIYEREGGRLRAALEEKGNTLAQFLAYDAEFGVLADDRETLGSLVNTALKVKDVVYARIRDREGRLLADAGGEAGLPAGELIPLSTAVVTLKEARRKEEIGFREDAPETSLPESSPGPGEEAFLSPPDEGEAEGPRAEEIGKVEIGLSTGAVTSAIAKARGTILLVTSLSLVLLSAIVAVLVGFVTRPVKQLVATTQRIAAGNLDEKMATTSRDEIGELAESFNLMVSKLRRSIEDLHQTSDFSQAMIPPKDVGSLLEVVLKRFLGLKKVSAASILLRDERTGAFRVAATSRPEGVFDLGFVRPEDWLECCRGTEGVVHLDGHREWMGGLLAQGADCLVPLKSKDTFVGAVALGFVSPGERFTAEELDLVNTFAYIGAMAIDNLRLLDIRTENEILKMELKFAHDIQMRLLPHETPESQRFKIHHLCLPAKDLGGDYYDFLRLEGGDRLGLTIADVAGKGVPAALYMASCRSFLRAEVGKHPNPGEVLTSINRLLYEDMKDKTFVSMFYGVFDPGSQVLEFSNAGHLFPILFRAGREGHDYLECPGFPLGITRGAAYADHRVELAPGDVLVFYTDGLIEAMNARKELFGFERFEDTVGNMGTRDPQGLVEGIMRELSAFVGEEPLNDDLTLIVVQVQ